MGSKWMVDCCGESGEGDERAMKQVLKDMDFGNFIEKQGSLAATVQKAIEDKGYRITDRGGGDGSWHIGVPFDDLAAAAAYTEYMTTLFSKAIGMGLLRFKVQTWSTSLWK